MNDSLADWILEKADAEQHWAYANNRLGHLCLRLNGPNDRQTLRTLLALIVGEYQIISDILDRLDQAEQAIEKAWHEAAAEVAQ